MDLDPHFSPPVFGSILWLAAPPRGFDEADAPPDCFHDLNLDQVEAAVTAPFLVERLAAFFRAPADSPRTVEYRQAVFRDLEPPGLHDAVGAFAAAIRGVNAALAGLDKLYYPRERQRARLDAAIVYCGALRKLDGAFAKLPHASAGLEAAHAYLAAYLASRSFTALLADTQRVAAALDGVRYELLVRAGAVTVRPCGGEPDASAEVLATFARFRTGDAAPVRESRGRSAAPHGLNHIEAQVLDKVTRLYPAPFAALDAFCERHAAFVEPVVARFAREVCFYLAWLRFVRPIRARGLAFCYPQVSADAKAIAATAAFDVALAAQRDGQRPRVVPNGFRLAGDERIIVVSGPNNGGKTTFARMVGQLQWLAALGCPVPGTSARTYLFDRIYTHFERQEDAASGRGKLQDDLLRIHAILAAATPRSVVVLNEIFSSTTLQDAIWLGRRIMAKLAALDALTVCVTFLDELATFDRRTVSMVAGVDPADPGIRTFRVTRRPPDGLAYAEAIARKYRVTRAGLLARIAP